MKHPIRVAIVEDDPSLRSHLATLLNSSREFCCTGSFADGPAALKEMAAAEPEVVLLDIKMPRMTGVECAGRLKDLLPRLHIIMLTAYDDSDLIFRALENGASGYLLKHTPPAELLRAIADVHAGGAPMSGHIARLVVQSFRRRPEQTEHPLTPREEEVLQLVARGLINKEIADHLGVTTETVRMHLKNCYAKLHVNSRTAAAMKLRGDR